jgi:DNA-binding transcriptional ArsR family regulator
MINVNQIAEIGTLLGEPSRVAILIALMDGQAKTASELARCANVTPQTASSHLARLIAADLLKVEKQGRHRYHRLATAEIAETLEGIMQDRVEGNTSSTKDFN